jgi:hypothetical protein
MAAEAAAPAASSSMIKKTVKTRPMALDIRPIG